MSDKLGIAISKPIGDPSAPVGSAHLLLEPIGPLNAGNDFNWWNLLVLKSDASVEFERRGCYAVYVASGSCLVHHLCAGDSEPSDKPGITLSAGKLREVKKPGYFSLRIKNSGAETLVAFVLLGVDPGTTPRQNNNPK